MVLTGGGSLLAGISRAARDQLGMSARVVAPQGLGGLTDSISAPPYAASSGLLIWGAKNWSADEDRAAARSLDGVGGRLSRLFRSLMP
jgi:cell division ATPase FtsA